MAVYDAQLNNTARATTQYTDLDLFFGRKSSNNDVRQVTDAQAVKRSLRNYASTPWSKYKCIKRWR